MHHQVQHRGEIKALTSLRGLAAMAVVLQHFSATAQLNASGWIPSIVPHGYMAVDFFFVLSGFIMSYTYLAEFETLGLKAYGPFLWKRVARIFPLGIAVTTILLLLGAVTSFWSMQWLFINEAARAEGLGLAVVINLLHLQGFFNGFNLNDPSWSISVELGAYLLFPALLFLVFHTRPMVTAVFIALGMLVMFKIASLSPGYGLGARWAPLDLGRCIAEFSFGMLVYRTYAGSSSWRRIGADRWTWLIVMLGVASFLARVDLLAAAVFPLVVLAFALNRGMPSRLLSTQIPYYLGTISFSIYLMHHMFRAPESWLVRYFHPAPLSPAMALTFAAFGSLSVLPFAALAYHTIERPGRTALNSIARYIARRVQYRHS